MTISDHLLPQYHRPDRQPTKQYQHQYYPNIHIITGRKLNDIHFMTAALVRRKGKGILAMALSSTSPFINTSAFSMSTSKCIRHQSSLSISSPSLMILRNQSASASCTRESSDMVEVDYDWLKQSRPMRIHARAIHPPNGNASAGGTESISSGVSKIIHFQRHGQGKLTCVCPLTW